MKKIIFILSIIFSATALGQNSPCVWKDGNYRYYVKLVTNTIPDANFNKTEFINRINSNSNLSNSDLNFLDNAIISASQAFPSSQNTNLQKTIIIVANNDTMENFLLNFPQSVELVENVCEEELASKKFNSTTEIKIYPNPSNEEFFIELNENENFNSLEVFNLSGQLLFSQEIKNLTSLSILNELNKGVYFLKFISEKNSVIKRIIKN